MRHTASSRRRYVCKPEDDLQFVRGPSIVVVHTHRRLYENWRIFAGVGVELKEVLAQNLFGKYNVCVQLSHTFLWFCALTKYHKSRKGSTAKLYTAR